MASSSTPPPPYHSHYHRHNHHSHALGHPPAAQLPNSLHSHIPTSGSQPPFVIDLNAIEAAGAAQPGAAHSAQEDATAQNAAQNNALGAALPSLRSALKPLESGLPFLLIILAKTLYDHRLGMSEWTK